MRTSYLCIPCFFRQIENTSSMVGLSLRKKRYLYEILTKRLLQFDFNYPPVVFGRIIYKTIARLSNKKDPFLKEKIKTERYLLKMIPQIEGYLKRSRSPLYLAAKMSCVANSIDFGAGKRPPLDNIMSQFKNARLYIDHFLIFKRRIKEKSVIVIIGDNCGEAIFDMLFIETLKETYPYVEVFYVTRSSPIINDVVISDTKRIGLQKLAKVISSGCSYPGILLDRISPSFRRIYRKADIVISKGQGNFESLNDENKDIFYLFKVKCPAVSRFLSIPQNKYIFLYNKLKVKSNHDA